MTREQSPNEMVRERAPETALPRRRDALPFAVQNAVEAVFGPDPGRLRLRAALRALISASMTLAILLPSLGASDKNAIAAIALGFMCAALSGRLLQGAPGEMLRSLVYVFVTAFGSAAAAALLPRDSVLRDCGLVLVAGTAVLARLAGQRGTFIGMVGFIAFFLCIVIRPGVSALPDMALASAVGFGCAGLVHLVLLPARPGRAIELILRDLDRRILTILAEVKSSSPNDAPSEAKRQRLHRHLARLSDGLLAAVDQFDRVQTSTPERSMELSFALLSLELSVERLARTALHTRAEDAMAAEWQQQKAGPAGRDLQRARNTLRRIARQGRGAQEPLVPTGAAPAAPTISLTWDNPIIRQTVQVIVAATLAVVLGSLLSEQRSYWALIAVFVVQSGVGSRGEALIKAVQRLAGTAAGVLAGLVLASLVSGHTIAAFALILACLFLAYFAFQQAYTLMIFGITLMLALLYGLIGQFTPDLLLLRLEETLVGAGVAGFAALFVLPLKQHETFRAASSEFVAALRKVIESAIDPDRRPDQELVMAMRSKAQAMRQALGAVKRGWTFLLKTDHRRTLRSAMRCDYLARELAQGEGLTQAEAQPVLAEISAIQSDLERRDKATDAGADGRALSPSTRPEILELMQELERLRGQLHANA